MASDRPDERSVAFVDLAGYTALTEAHGDESAADLVAMFAELAAEAVAGRGRFVKTIGDAVMLVFDHPAPAIAAVGTLIESCVVREMPLVRAGLHHGPVVERAGDWFGTTVNIAARLAAEAAPGRALVSGVLAEAARSLGLDVVALGPRQLRNLAQPVDAFEVQFIADESDLAIDPVCRMQVQRRAAAGSVQHDGRAYWLCSMDCLARFADSPGLYVS